LLKVLFVCGKNQWRSPTAEQIFSEHPGVECASAGVSRDADVLISIELLAWADLIFVMEKAHRTKLTAQFQAELKHKRLICLNIPDQYRFMDTKLIELLKRKVTPFLP
jgi:predicted protein tyrosine phosphatase